MAVVSSEYGIQVVAGPSNYYSYEGSFEQLLRIFNPDILNNALWLHGKRAWQAAIPFLPQGAIQEGADIIAFDGYCSEEDIARLQHEASPHRQLIIGVGGGRVLDTAKALANRLSLPFVAIPTIAATCAAWTPLSVWYNASGQALGYEIFDNANQLVLVEPTILRQAPRDYLLAGIGDTLAKWYEAVILCPQPETLPLTARIGLETARIIRDVLLSLSEQALREQEQGQHGQAFRDVIDAILAGGGLVGGLGERHTRIAAAHAIHNGLTVLPQTHRFLHGTKVAYGILVQTALLQDTRTLQHLMAAFHRFRLPINLAALDIDADNAAELDALIAHTLRPSESIHLLSEPVTPGRLLHAIKQVEIAAQQFAHATERQG